MKKQPSSRHKEIETGKKVFNEPSSTPFPVIGLGSSAGGLEALELFMKNVPDSSGMAFVIVQHLDPTHKGIMAELLQRVTPIPVQQITDRLKIEPDHIYLIPPNKNLTILHGVLHLLDMVKPRGLRLPIDFFFRSMADDLHQHSLGVILSGMGSDGTFGLRAIKEKGGAVFVQDPESAKFDGMPRSAIDAGLADVIAPVEMLPEKIISYLKHEQLNFKQTDTLEDASLSALAKVIILLRSQTGHDFSLYKKNTIYRRIERRMSIHQIQKISFYVKYLQENPQEIELLFRELLIGVTSFFRDPAAWEIMKKRAIPSLIAARPSGGLLRAWVAGCSTGEEAYTLAILFREVIDAIKPAGNFKLQIFATDLDKDAIDKARAGVYPSNIVADLTAEHIKRYFDKDDSGYKIKREIRETIVFAPHNVIMDPPFTKLDIVICRNLLIYMEQELQKKLLPLFHYSLNNGGILFLGSAETIGANNNLFETVDGKARIFRHIHQHSRTLPIDFPSSLINFPPPSRDFSAHPATVTSELNLKAITDQLLLDHYTPAAVLTNENGDIIYISGHTGKYLEPAAGKANLNVFAMAREGIRYDLNILFGHVQHEKGELTKKGLTVGTNGGKQSVDLSVKLLEQPEPLRGLVMIVFTDSTKFVSGIDSDRTLAEYSGDGRIALLENELQVAKDEILSIREQMQTSQEELKSTNEEMQSANEELQSTNEELNTSKEEMQSLNEELQTVNHELQSKVSDFSQTNNDMKNLLNSTDIATLFLDDELNIRRFTNRTATIIKLIPADIGRPITDIATDLHYPALESDAREVLQSLVMSEKNIAASNNRWFKVKIMPYRTLDNRIDGLVITFNDITTAMRLEESLRETDESYRFLIDTMQIGALIQDASGTVIMINREAYRIFGFSKEEIKGKLLDQLPLKFVRSDGTDLPQDERPSQIALRTGNPVRGVVIGIMGHSDKNFTWINVNCFPRIRKGGDKADMTYISFYEISGPTKPVTE
ncbi:chemotaxis protein CheB [Chlorobium ferrooxidans]|uniref:protein-glutamate O-methyltransferase n=1 Tax=Chlorobium ferrooxidans DSM 13031 TaxID=377431 RepID=Q0YQ86_9CHLB|nr:chemotaxis protein CheB [Chlorobium ferrooxidans]EAT58468.1 CheB methylesterase:MCP methyltransferase, CheR-type [Chlorobium ferrooxidans DSM 13031]